MTTQACCARPAWTFGYLVFHGLYTHDHWFLLPFTFRFRFKLQRTLCLRPVILLRSWPTPFPVHISLCSHVLWIRWTLSLKRGGSTPLRESLTGWASPPTTNAIWGCLKLVFTLFYVAGSPQSSSLGLRWCSAFASHPFGAFFGCRQSKKHRHICIARICEWIKNWNFR